MIFTELKESEFVNEIMEKFRQQEGWEFTTSHNDAFRLVEAVRATQDVEGDVAEVGVYKGGSAAMICEVKGDKTIHLFDTFQGLPKLGRYDKDTDYAQGQYAADIKSVRKRLESYSNVYFYKGLFPKTGEPIKNKKFSLVHLDLDLYKSTLDALKFFWPRMNPRGIIISHDYQVDKSFPQGVFKAFAQYFKGTQKIYSELGTKQAIVIK